MKNNDLKELCTFAKNTGMLQESFIHVVLTNAAFSAAFDAANMQYLMNNGLLPKASKEEIDKAIAKAEDLYSTWLMERANK